MMVLALLPLGLISVSQTRSIVDQAEAAMLDAVLGETVQAASSEIRIIRSAQAMVRTLAETVIPFIDDDQTCSGMMDAAKRTEPGASLVAFTPMSGLMTCASDGEVFDFSESERFQALVAEPVRRMTISRAGAVSGTSVLNISHPVLAADGEQLGIVSVSLRHAAIAFASAITPNENSRNPVALITFDRAGTPLTSTVDGESAFSHLPANHALNDLVAGGSFTFADHSIADESHIYAVVPIEGDLFLLGIWPDSDDSVLFSAGVEPFLLPVLMWIAGLVVAFLASERLVIRHLRRLVRSMRAFTGGDRNIAPLRLDNPPSEIESLAETYQQMTETILRDEAELEHLLRQKEELLREVHHRTGNSLQLIASILRMHLREDPDDEMRGLLENLHDRVMSLSTVHVGLYRMAGRADVEVDELMSEVIGKIASIHGRFGRKDAIETHLEPVLLTAQQAVPLALLLAEILSSFPGNKIAEGEAPISVKLEQVDGNAARLAISGPAIARGALTGEGQGAPEIIAGRLIRAFVAQLGGSLAVIGDGNRVAATVTFTCRIAVSPPPAPKPPATRALAAE